MRINKVSKVTEAQVGAFLAGADEETVIRIVDRLGSAWSGFEPKQVGKLFEESMPKALRPLSDDELVSSIVEEGRLLQRAEEAEVEAAVRRADEIRATLGKNRAVFDHEAVAWSDDEAVDDWQRVASLQAPDKKET